MRAVRRTVGLAAAACAVLVVSVLPASAGTDVGGYMVGTPNPAMVGDSVMVSNTSDEVSTCMYYFDVALVQANEAYVVLSITAPDSSTMGPIQVEPDNDGNWSYSFDADQVGTYMVDASCFIEKKKKEETATPAAMAPFVYNSLDVVVNQVPDTLEPTTTSMETADTSGETTTTAAAAVAAGPRYTG